MLWSGIVHAADLSILARMFFASFLATEPDYVQKTQDAVISSLTWVLEHEPDRCYLALDSGELERKKLNPLYKRGRSSPPPEYWGMYESLLGEVANHFADEIQLVVSPGWEADDVMATIAAKSVTAGKKCVLMTNDKDLRQSLVAGKVTIQRRVRNQFGIPDWGFLTSGDAELDWGVPQEWLLSAQILCGDTAVDEVDGVKGVGLKTAASLLMSHGGFAKLKEASLRGEIPGAVGKALLEFWPKEDLARQLITLKKDCQLIDPFTKKEIVF